MKDEVEILIEHQANAIKNAFDSWIVDSLLKETLSVGAIVRVAAGNLVVGRVVRIQDSSVAIELMLDVDGNRMPPGVYTSVSTRNVSALTPQDIAKLRLEGKL